MVTPVILGAAVGGVLGAVFIAVLVTGIIYITKRLKKKTNSRSKLITSNGNVYKDKWAENESNMRGPPNNDRLYFGHIDRTEHVEVKEKRRREEIIIPPKPIQKLYPPLPRPAPLPPPVYPPSPRLQPPRSPTRLKRYKVRSWPKKVRESPVVKRRASISNAEGAKYFIYGLPYPMQRGTYPTWIPPPVLPAQMPTVLPESLPAPVQPPPPAPAQPPHECQDIEEQERVMVIDEAATEKSFNPRWNGAVAGLVSASSTSHDISGHQSSLETSQYRTYSHDYVGDSTQHQIADGPEPRIVTKLL